MDPILEDYLELLEDMRETECGTSSLHALMDSAYEYLDKIKNEYCQETYILMYKDFISVLEAIGVMTYTDNTKKRGVQ